MKLKIKLLHASAKIPKYAHESDACFDLVATAPAQVWGGVTVIGTGIAVDVPEGFALMVYGRSGMGSKGITLANCVGVVDPGYHGEVKVMLKASTITPYHIEAGDRIAQAMLIERPTVEFEQVTELEPSQRGEGGFGSTGA